MFHGLQNIIIMICNKFNRLPKIGIYTYIQKKSYLASRKKMAPTQGVQSMVINKKNEFIERNTKKNSQTEGE